ncbi:MAG: S49 family peptidase [Acetobacter sp.]|jgi:ClpP class serine protease|nr:S49 family peptidase [Acetobacter sp.]MCH4060484.1 S49 family peptidase [Acetobacter sp.]MCH4087424.1 S49 family peptidase [Acetobacter sp.]MCI1293942.1 S49 family peptidase [Acetobacter sp.]MCI1320464.1 S49 family peptidase [Acetobacter sp.]
MTRLYALEAIRAAPWAIQPEWLAAIEAVAERMMLSPDLEKLREADNSARYQGMMAALAGSGTRLEGAKTATLSNGVAMIPVMGPIMPYANMMADICGYTTLETLASDLRVASGNSNVRQILLVMDSPGGATVQLSDAAGQIASMDKPVTVFVTGTAASAAYWLASQADEIVMDSLALAGSIGIVCSTSTQVGPDSNGRKGVDIVSSNAPNKRLDPSTDDGQAQIRSVLDDMEAIFMADVARGRKTTVANVQQNFGQGGMKSAKSAVSAGMADRIDTLSHTLARLGSMNSLKPSVKTASKRNSALAEDLEARRKRSEGQ